MVSGVVFFHGVNMKTVSPDKGYIDYTHGNCGIRVCPNLCQAIARDEATSKWTPRENAQTLPVAESILTMKIVQWRPITALAAALARYEDKELDSELRRVLKGELSFNDALSDRG